MHNYAAVNSQALATSQEQQLSALGDGDADACPRYDDQTQALVERGLHLGDRVVLSCTVREGRPLYLTRAEVPTALHPALTPSLTPVIEAGQDIEL